LCVASQVAVRHYTIAPLPVSIIPGLTHFTEHIK
jgi:hypothetical protein